MKIAAIIPCFNEEASIGSVVLALTNEVPDISIYVCDNGSTDRTVEAAIASGATVLSEKRKGKGNAVRRLFRDIDADVYVMIDGDNTYGTEMISEAIQLIISGHDMVTGERMLSTVNQRKGHAFGNKLFTQLLRTLFKVSSRDVFSGLRIMSRRLVKTFPCLSLEFELEAELEIFCARMRLPVTGLPASIRERVNSESKLNTLKDGAKICGLALRMLHREYPLRVYLPIFLVTEIVCLILLLPLIWTYMETSLVPRFPTLIILGVLAMIGFLSLGIGLVLKEITNSRYENRYLRYLEVQSVNSNRHTLF